MHLQALALWASRAVMTVPKEEISMGKTVNFTTRPDLIQLFDKESSNNLIWYDAESASKDAPVCKRYDF